MYHAQDEKEQGLCFAAASMAAEALALSRLVCTEGEALMQSGTPELYRSAAKLLTAVTQAQRDLNGRLSAVSKNSGGTGRKPCRGNAPLKKARGFGWMARKTSACFPAGRTA